MKDNEISLAYLQSLSTADLLLLADDYGIDIPEQLNRSFIISELYEIAQESLSDEFDSEIVKTDTIVENSMTLPETYNETTVDFVLRTPAWIYVFWDISNSDLHNIIMQRNFVRLFLKICFWNEDEEKPEYSFEISVSPESKYQYVLIPSNKKKISINLVAELSGKKFENLATSRQLMIPQSRPEITLESLDAPIEPILELSGMRELLKSQYESHRESFS